MIQLLDEAINKVKTLPSVSAISKKTILEITLSKEDEN
jgi:hypothetical protein